MNWKGGVRWLAMATILVILVLSGPVVPSIDFTTDSSISPDTAEGSASIEILSAPSDSARVESGRFGTGYFLTAPELILHVRTVRGTPKLIYEIAVPGISQNFVKFVFLDETYQGRSMTLRIARLSIAEYKLDRKSYRGDLSLKIRSDNDTRTVIRQNITITVQDTDG